MDRSTIVRATIDSLRANVALLDQRGSIIVVNDRWRRFGRRRGARTDYVGLNYLDVCAAAARRGDRSAERVAQGLQRLLSGEAETFGLAYQCAERIFRMSARPLHNPLGGVIVAHEDITGLMQARRERRQSQQALAETRTQHAMRMDAAHEQLGQKLTAISLATVALKEGGDMADAVTLISMAVEEARRELRMLRYEAEKEAGGEA